MLDIDKDFIFTRLKRTIAKATYRLGAGIGTELILPKNLTNIRTYTKAEDSIPVFVKPKFGRRYNSIDGKDEKWIEGTTNEPMYLDFTQGKFFLIVSPPGAGKTFLMRGIAGELIEAGYSVVCLADQKNDFHSSTQPIQEKFLKLMPPWRIPNALRMACISPLYIKTKEKMSNPRWYAPQDITFFQLSLKDLTPDDLIVALGLEYSEPQAILLKRAWNLENPPKTLNQLYWRITHVDMKSILKDRGITVGEKIGVFATQTINALMNRIADLEREEFIGEEANIDIISLIEKGYFLDLCLCDNLTYSYHASYVYNLIRRIYKEKRAGGRLEKVRMAFMFPDIGTFVLPNKREPVSKQLILRDLISLGRQKGIYVIGDTQNLTQVPPEAYEQVQTWIFYGTISGTDLEIISKINKKRYGELRELMDKYSHDLIGKFPLRGVIVWERTGKTRLAYCPPPSSAHGEQLA